MVKGASEALGRRVCFRVLWGEGGVRGEVFVRGGGGAGMEGVSVRLGRGLGGGEGVLHRGMGQGAVSCVGGHGRGRQHTHTQACSAPTYVTSSSMPSTVQLWGVVRCVAQQSLSTSVVLGVCLAAGRQLWLSVCLSGHKGGLSQRAATPAHPQYTRFLRDCKCTCTHAHAWVMHTTRGSCV